jgi:ATP-dependent Clp protease ATP-binding subunit ClpA
MFERFTEQARQVVVLAQDEAATLGHNHIGTEHLLLGLIREGHGVAARVLADLGVDLDEARDRVVQLVRAGERTASPQIPFTPGAKKVLEMSLREAMNLQQSYLGTEHLLLALARENEGVAARILLDLGADSQKVRDEVTRVLDTPHYAQQRGSAAIPPTAIARSALFAGWLDPALQHATAEARKRGERSLDSGDLLLSLTLDQTNVAARALSSLGVSIEALRGAVRASRDSDPGRNPSEADPSN